MQQAAGQMTPRWGELLGRLGAASGLLVLGAGLVTARALEPAASGLGTHQRLGLPPCTFYALTGLPCPTCGLTTSFAHVARGQVVEAMRVQPFGVLCCAAAVLLAGYFAAFLVWGRRAALWLASLRLDALRWTAGFAAFAALSWFYKIIAVVTLKQG